MDARQHFFCLLGSLRLKVAVQNGCDAIGYLTISNALQWRLQYRRVIEKADAVAGVARL